ncbi:MAG: hypothetical protein MJZ26_10170 [Fibrobacter sp.]|nr:hypothetical protein [Fibrobacter sp.]
MCSLRIDCPHCNSSFDVQIEGEPSNMMVFCCARCKTPLMFYHGVVSELDRDEFANLRKRLSRALDAVVNKDGAMAEVVEVIKEMVQESDQRAAERASENEPSVVQDKKTLTDESIDALQKQLDEMDAESFLDNL